MKRLKQLFVILDTHTEDQPALRRARYLAQRSQAGLVLYLPAERPTVAADPYSSLVVTGPSGESHQEEQREWLTALASDLNEEGIPTDTIFESDDNGASTAMDSIEAVDCDLVMLAAHHHQWLDKLLHLHRDWDLIRHCRKPLWICRPPPLSNAPRILVGVSLEQSAACRAMDEELSATGQWLASHLGGAMHLVHCLEPESPALATPISSMGSRPLALSTIEMEERHADSFNHLALRFGVLPSRKHFKTGSAKRELPTVASDISADCVVLGNAARSGLERLALGNTAEVILDKLPMDVLIVPARRSAS